MELEIEPFNLVYGSSNDVCSIYAFGACLLGTPATVAPIFHRKKA